MKSILINNVWNYLIEKKNIKNTICIFDIFSLEDEYKVLMNFCFYKTDIFSKCISIVDNVETDENKLCLQFHMLCKSNFSFRVQYLTYSKFYQCRKCLKNLNSKTFDCERKSKLELENDSYVFEQKRDL
jgi:hypothetical protein